MHVKDESQNPCRCKGGTQHVQEGSRICAGDGAGIDDGGLRADRRRCKPDFRKACYYCKKAGECIQQDDVPAILQQMTEADVIVLATPVYFYTMNGQLKTLIDRCLACGAKLTDKEFYFIATAAAGKEEMERTMDGLRGFTDCLPGAKISGLIYGVGAWQLGEIQGNPAMQQAYQMGKAID